MAKYAITQDGSDSLKQLADNLFKYANNIIESVQSLEAVTNSLYNDLGIYGDEILGIIQSNNRILSSNREDIINLSQRVSQQAEAVAELVSLGLGDMPSDSGAGLNLSSRGLLSGRYASQEERPKILIRDKDEATAAGMRYIDDQMEAVRDDLRDKGITDAAYIESVVAQKREEAEIEFFNELYGTIEHNSLASLQRLSSYFTEDGWASLNVDERQDALNTLAIDAGNAYRTEIKGVEFFDGPPNERGYYNGDGYLYINSDCLTNPANRLDAIDTVYHEGRHAYQHAAINNPSKYGITSEQARIWQDNFNHYLSSSRFGYERYFNQPVESDAYGFADYVIRNGGIS